VGAGLAVSGSYYLAGDSLRFVVELTDAGEGKLLKSLDPVLTGVTDPMPGLERVRRAVAGALALTVDPVFEGVASSAQSPPSYESAKAFSEAVAAFWRDYAEGQRLAHKAFSLDTTYEVARVFEAVSYMNMGEWDLADSLAKLSEARQPRLGPYDRSMLLWMRAELDGDRQAAYRATEEGLRIAPNDHSRKQLGFENIKLNRPRAALAIFASIDPRSPQLTGVWSYWQQYAWTYHMLGDHDKELDVAREGRKQYPQLAGPVTTELLALAAMGRVDEVNRALDETLNLPPQPGLTPGSIANLAGVEFRAHGDSGSAAKAFARAIAWYQRLPEPQREGQYMGYGEALYNAGRLDEAASVISRGCARTPESVPCLGWAGLTRAAQGQRDEALALIDEIGRTDSTPRVRIGEQAWFQARIYAALNERERAVESLRRALAHGGSFGWAVHWYVNSLRNYPPFEELIRPKE
jgi:tetratricopeptide (TPR) repeat protein